MALDDLLRAIESDASDERVRAEHETAAEAAAIVAEARRQATELEAELAAAPEAEARAEAESARALARLHAAGAVRSAREESFASLVTSIRSELAALRGTERYPEVFRALLDEGRHALPTARRLRVDPRDVDVATPLSAGLRLEPALDTWGGVELVTDDGRVLRNTVEERLANAEPRLRRQFSQRLRTGAG